MRRNLLLIFALVVVFAACKAERVPDQDQQIETGEIQLTGVLRVSGSELLLYPDERSAEKFNGLSAEGVFTIKDLRFKKLYEEAYYKSGVECSGDKYRLTGTVFEWEIVFPYAIRDITTHEWIASTDSSFVACGIEIS